MIEPRNGKSERKRNCDEDAVQPYPNAPVLNVAENKLPKHNFIILFAFGISTHSHQ